MDCLILTLLWYISLLLSSLNLFQTNSTFSLVQPLNVLSWVLHFVVLQDLRSLLAQLTDADSPEALHAAGRHLADAINTAQRRRQQICSEEIKAAVEERDNALNKVTFSMTIIRDLYHAASAARFLLWETAVGLPLILSPLHKSVAEIDQNDQIWAMTCAPFDSRAIY